MLLEIYRIFAHLWQKSGKMVSGANVCVCVGGWLFKLLHLLKPKSAHFIFPLTAHSLSTCLSPQKSTWQVYSITMLRFEKIGLFIV